MHDPYSPSVSLSPSCTHTSLMPVYVSEPQSLFLSPSNCYLSIFPSVQSVQEKERESSEGKGQVVVDNVCKFVREHPVPCNRYTVLLCLLLYLLISLSPLSSPALFFFFKIPFKPSLLLHLLFVYLSIHPCIHPSLGLTVVSCREAVNNSSGWVVLPFPAPHVWLAVALRNIR